MLKALRQRFQEAGFHYFIEKTDIHNKLANKTLHPLGIAYAVKCHLYDFSVAVEEDVSDPATQMLKPIIIKILLQDHPEALEYLKAYGILPKE